MNLVASNWNGIKDENGDIIATVTSSPDMEKFQQKIISAVNNTYGKGINPEGVEKMRQVLELEEHYASSAWFEHKGKRFDFSDYESTAENYLSDLREEALTASKL